MLLKAGLSHGAFNGVFAAQSKVICRIVHMTARFQMLGRFKMPESCNVELLAQTTLPLILPRLPRRTS